MLKMFVKQPLVSPGSAKKVVMLKQKMASNWLAHILLSHHLEAIHLISLNCVQLYNCDTWVKHVCTCVCTCIQLCQVFTCVCTCVQLCQESRGVKLYFCRGLHDSMSTSLCSSAAGCEWVHLSPVKYRSVQCSTDRKVANFPKSRFPLPQNFRIRKICVFCVFCWVKSA